MKTYKPIIVDSILPEDSGNYEVGSNDCPFASGNFLNIGISGHIIRVTDGGQLTIDGAGIVSGQASYSNFLLMGA